MDYEIVTLEKKVVAGVSAKTSNNSPDMRSTNRRTVAEA